MWRWTLWERLCQDLRYAARMFARNPAFVMTTVVSVALGIGGNAAMFSPLIRPLPYADSSGLVRITRCLSEGRAGAGLVRFHGAAPWKSPP